MEEVILRDVPRTFPEHPLFNTADGQQRLLRVLKAYAAADPEVSCVPVWLANLHGTSQQGSASVRTPLPACSADSRPLCRLYTQHL